VYVGSISSTRSCSDISWLFATIDAWYIPVSFSTAKEYSDIISFNFRDEILLHGRGFLRTRDAWNGEGRNLQPMIHRLRGPSLWLRLAGWGLSGWVVLLPQSRKTKIDDKWQCPVWQSTKKV
jgi:hypothetical protein